jgi:hypothetical protein
MSISADFLEARAVFDYDPDSGLLTRPHSTQGAKAGSAGCVRPDGYVCVGFRGKRQLQHRVIWLWMTGEWPTDLVDHINGNRSDNRWSNLRPADKRLNGQNRRRASAKNKHSGLLGVRPSPGNRWRAEIRVPCEALASGSKCLHIGTFATPEEAHSAYLTAKRKHHEGCTL